MDLISKKYAVLSFDRHPVDYDHICKIWAMHSLYITVCTTFKKVVRELTTKPYALILIIDYDEMDYLPFFPVFKKIQPYCAILFIGIRFDHQQKIKALNAGADNYIVGNRHNYDEAIATALALIRLYDRFEKVKVTRMLEADGFILNVESKTLIVDGKEIFLTPNEYRFLFVLMKHKGEIVSYKEILTKVYQSKYIAGSNHIIWNMVRRLKRKIITVNPQLAEYIYNKYNLGYCLGMENKHQSIQ